MPAMMQAIPRQLCRFTIYTTKVIPPVALYFSLCYRNPPTNVYIFLHNFAISTYYCQLIVISSRLSASKQLLSCCSLVLLYFLFVFVNRDFTRSDMKAWQLPWYAICKIALGKFLKITEIHNFLINAKAICSTNRRRKN